jgi:hypothetical protein
MSAVSLQTQIIQQFIEPALEPSQLEQRALLFSYAVTLDFQEGPYRYFEHRFFDRYIAPLIQAYLNSEEVHKQAPALDVRVAFEPLFDRLLRQSLFDLLITKIIIDPALAPHQLHFNAMSLEKSPGIFMVEEYERFKDRFFERYVVQRSETLINWEGAVNLFPHASLRYIREVFKTKVDTSLRQLCIPVPEYDGGVTIQDIREFLPPDTMNPESTCVVL